MKIQIRKGLFETSSSSEDSLSIYQDMELYILPKDLYKKFEDGELYVKFVHNSIIPIIALDKDFVKEENNRVAKANKLKKDSKGEISVYYCYGHKSDLYVNYQTYIDMVKYYFSDVDFFTKENNDEVIFGYYGYTEE